MKAYVVIVHIVDFQMGIESYQRKVNLTPPMLACIGIQKIKCWTCFTRPGFGLCVVYKTDKKQKRLFRVVKVAKFSSSTLIKILRKLERIKRRVEKLQIEMTASNHRMLTIVVKVIRERLHIMHHGEECNKGSDVEAAPTEYP